MTPQIGPLPQKSLVCIGNSTGHQLFCTGFCPCSSLPFERSPLHALIKSIHSLMILFMFGYIIGLIIAIIIDVALAFVFADKAGQKGHDESAYFWICFFLGIVGYCMVAALPDMVVRSQLDLISKRLNNPEAPSAAPKQTSKPAPFVNLAPNVTRNATRTPSGWKCSCGRTHPAHVSSCSCGVNKSDLK